jgi:branched-subunit amino acid ABC-type transport system permease component
VETVTAYFTDTQIAEGVSYAVLVLVLLLRPSGLFGEKE